MKWIKDFQIPTIGEIILWSIILPIIIVILIGKGIILTNKKVKKQKEKVS